MCLYPKLVTNPKYRANKKNGGVIPPMQDERVGLVPIGCGMCMECMKQKANQWRLRLMQDIETHKGGKFVTLTFSNESYTELTKDLKTKIEGYSLDNAVATLAIRRFLERHRKEHKRSLRHWLITEIGGGQTEHIHLHGIIWTNDLNNVEKHWKYGWIWKGREKYGKLINYVGERTVNYIIKYVTKVDQVHKHYKPVILCSPGIGSEYTKTYNSTKNKFKWETTKETFTTRQGKQIALPTYWRNKLYSEQQREQLWLQKLDQQVRYVNGEKVDISQGEEKYYKLLEWHRRKNRELGYGDPSNWDAKQYELQRRKLKQQERMKNTRKRV